MCIVIVATVTAVNVLICRPQLDECPMRKDIGLVYRVSPRNLTHLDTISERLLLVAYTEEEGHIQWQEEDHVHICRQLVDIMHVVDFYCEQTPTLNRIGQVFVNNS